MRTASWLSCGLVLAACGGGEASSGTQTSGAELDGGDAAVDGSSSTGAGESSTSLPPFPDPPADDGPPSPSQSASCKVWVACAMALMRRDVGAIIDEYGSLGTCWEDATTAAACDDACTDALETTRAAAETAGEMLPDACVPPRDVPLSEIVAIIDAHCVDQCHEPGGEEPSLDLSEQPRTELLGVYGSQASIPHVAAGDHDGSYLWHKVSGTQGSVGGSGARMPAGAPALMPEQIDAIADWIDVGAPP